MSNTGSTSLPDRGEPADLFYDNFENGGANWVSAAITGSNAWSFGSGYTTSGSTLLYGVDYDSTTDSYAKMKAAVALPGKAYLHFNHAFEFEAGASSSFDGGVIEYSIDGGSTWPDAGSLIAANGYNATISSNYHNPLGGRQAFGRLSYGYLSSRLDLDQLAGQNVQFRFRIGADSSLGALGWVIDDVRIYTCQFTTSAAKKNLTVTMAGTGAGNVNSVPSGIACTIGNCTGQFDLAQQVTLAAAASAGSLFSGWSDPAITGTCSNTTGDCLVTMNADKNVSATFDLVPKVHLLGGVKYFGTIQSAYNDAVNIDTIEVQGIDLTENLTLDRGIAVTLTGGYDGNFVNRTGVTGLHGALTVKNGTLHIGGIVIK